MSPEERARRKQFVQQFGWGGFGDEDVDLSLSPDPQNSTQLSPQQLGTLRNDIQKLLEGRKDCADFVNALLNNVAAATQRPLYSTDPLKVFDAVAGQRGFFLAPGQGASGYAWGSIRGGDAKITLDVSFGGFSFVRGLVGLHEVIHEASGAKNQLYSDRDLAVAAYQVAIAQGYKDVPKPPGPNDVLLSSQYYNDRLFKACSPNQRK